MLDDIDSQVVATVSSTGAGATGYVLNLIALPWTSFLIAVFFAGVAAAAWHVIDLESDKVAARKFWRTVAEGCFAGFLAVVAASAMTLSPSWALLLAVIAGSIGKPAVVAVRKRFMKQIDGESN